MWVWKDARQQQQQVALRGGKVGGWGSVVNTLSWRSLVLGPPVRWPTERLFNWKVSLQDTVA